MHLSVFNIIVVLIFENCHCIRMMKVIPGVPTISFYDSNYLKDIIFTTRRNGRRSDYVVNLEFTTKVTFGRNISAAGIYYEYLHNEYRRSFVEWHGNLCTLVLKDQLVGALIRKNGFNVCPFPAGKYKLHNLTFDQEFPNVFPFTNGKGELILGSESTRKLIVKGDLFYLSTFVIMVQLPDILAPRFADEDSDL